MCKPHPPPYEVCGRPQQKDSLRNVVLVLVEVESVKVCVVREDVEVVRVSVVSVTF